MLHPALGRLLLCAALALGTTIGSAISDVAPAWAQSDEAGYEDEVPHSDDGGEVSADGDVGMENSDGAEAGDGESASHDQGPAGETRQSDEDRSSIDAPDMSPPRTQNADRQTRGPEAAPPASAASNGGSIGEDRYGVMLDTRNADYYDRRAAELLKSDRKGAHIGEHPLESAYPGHYVVICQAGCPDGTGAQIVSMTPRIDVAPQIADPRQDMPGYISCVGGCPSGRPGQFVSLPGTAASGSQMAASVGEWMTTVARLPSGGAQSPASPARAPGSGDWMEKINADRAATAAQIKAAPANGAPAQPVPAAASPVVSQGDNKKAGASDTAREPSVPAAAKSPSVKAALPSAADSAAANAPTAKPTSAVQQPDDASPAVRDEPSRPQALAETVVKAPGTEAVEARNTASAPRTSHNPVKATEASVLTKQDPARSVDAALNGEFKKSPVAQPAVRESEVAPAPVRQPEESEPSASPSLSGEAQPRQPQSTAEARMKVAAATPENGPKNSVLHGDRDKVMSVLSEDEEMNAAIAKARASLSDFWKSYEKPGANEGDFALKVAISDKGVTEHFWLTRIQRVGEKLSGVISNQPQSVKSVKLGQTYEFTADMISDWTFKRNGKLVGNETMRVLLPRMPAEQAAAYRAMYETP